MSLSSLTYLRGFVQGTFTRDNNKGLIHTLNAINVAERLHDGQKRKSGEDYISHPIQVVLELKDLKIMDDKTLAAAILHDVVEDCNITPKQLINDYNIDSEVVGIVVLLTKMKGMSIDLYYKSIEKDWRACLIKISDRCHNISTMIDGFSKEKMKQYVEETNEYIIPLCKYVIRYFPQYADEVYIMKKHILSICELVNSLLKEVA